MQEMLRDFAIVDMPVSVAHLTEGEQEAVKELIAASEPLNRIYAHQAYANSPLLLSFLDDIDTSQLPPEIRGDVHEYREFVRLHFGPHHSADHQKFFPRFSQEQFLAALSTTPHAENPDLETILDVIFNPNFDSERPLGANVYRFDSSLDVESVREFVDGELSAEKKDPNFDGYKRRGATDSYCLSDIVSKDGKPSSMQNTPFHEIFATDISDAVGHLRRAAELVEDETFAAYLRACATGMETDEYRERDMLFLDTDYKIGIMIGPIETYIDKLAGIKAAFEAIVYVRDEKSTEILDKFHRLAPTFIANLPCDDAYKNKKSPEKLPMELVNVVYFGGQAAEGPKTAANALPNDEAVHVIKGYRTTFFMNIMNAKAQRILMPIANIVLGEDVVASYGADTLCEAFELHIIGHESSHPLGRTKEGLDPSVRNYLKELYAPLEECKAHTLGLYNLDVLVDQGIIGQDLRDASYVSYVPGIFRSMRLGTQVAHARANTIILNYVMERGGISQQKDGRYVTDFSKFRTAIGELANELLTIEGEGDYQRAKTFSERYIKITPAIKTTLEKIDSAGIPRDLHTNFQLVN